MERIEYENDTTSSEEESENEVPDAYIQVERKKDDNEENVESEFKRGNTAEVDSERTEEKEGCEVKNEIPDDLPDLIKGLDAEDESKSIHEKKALLMNDSNSFNSFVATIDIPECSGVEIRSDLNSECESSGSSRNSMMNQRFYEIDLNHSTDSAEAALSENELDGNESIINNVEATGNNEHYEEQQKSNDDNDAMIKSEENCTYAKTTDDACDLRRIEDDNVVDLNNVQGNEYLNEKQELLKEKWSLLDEDFNQDFDLEIRDNKKLLISEVPKDFYEMIKTKEGGNTEFIIPKIIIEDTDYDTESQNINFPTKHTSQENKNQLCITAYSERTNPMCHIPIGIIEKNELMEEVGITKGFAIEEDGANKELTIRQDEATDMEKDSNESILKRDFEINCHAPHMDIEVTNNLQTSNCGKFNLNEMKDNKIYDVIDDLMNIEKRDESEILENVTKCNIDKLEDFLLNSSCETEDLFSIRTKRKENRFVENNVAELRKDIKEMEQSMMHSKIFYDLNIKELKNTLVSGNDEKTNTLPNIQTHHGNEIKKALIELSKERKVKSYLSEEYDKLIIAHDGIESINECNVDFVIDSIANQQITNGNMDTESEENEKISLNSTLELQMANIDDDCK